MVRCRRLLAVRGWVRLWVLAQGWEMGRGLAGVHRKRRGSWSRQAESDRNEEPSPSGGGGGMISREKVRGKDERATLTDGSAHAISPGDRKPGIAGIQGGAGMGP